uniref:Uncharacterized protein n=1 Tax=Bactrocera dorsalis TaxID=27457 RepID=A0A034VMM5_BACDO
MAAYADSIAPVKFVLTNSPLPKYESQRNKRRADHIVPEPLSSKDDTTEGNEARKYYDLNITNEKLFTDTEEDDGKKPNPCEKRSSQLNYNSDSSGHSIPTVKLSYEMRKIYYYL